MTEVIGIGLCTNVLFAEIEQYKPVLVFKYFSNDNLFSSFTANGLVDI